MMYPPNSVAMTGTHDTEPLAVWWESLTPAERRRFGFDSPVFNEAVRDGLLNLMFNAGSNLLLLPIQDVFGWRDRINQPATINEINWTYVLPWPVDQMAMQPEANERAESPRGMEPRDWAVVPARLSRYCPRFPHYKTVILCPPLNRPF